MYKIEELIDRANDIHGKKYSYDISTYNKVSEKMKIICPEHGEFWQSLHQHINKKQGCPLCGNITKTNKRRYTSEQFIKECYKIHGDKYDYNKVEYFDSQTKVCIVCPKHGEFWQRPDMHLLGNGCPICKEGKRTNRNKKNKILSIEEYLDKCDEKFSRKFSYDMSEYENLSSKIKITCPSHGVFYRNAYSHLNSICGCPKCSYENDSHRKNYSTEEFIKKAQEVHNNKYDYSKVVYNNQNEKVCIICPEHGEFWQLPYNHLTGNGCPICSRIIGQTSEQENELYTFICDNIDTEILRNDRSAIGKELDIYIPSLHIAFEYDGLYWHSEIQKPDKKYHLNKTELCENNGIQLIHIFEDEWLHKKEICKSRILNILGKTKNKIYARKCEVKNVNSKTTSEFLNKNHIQGKVLSSINIGLYYDNELVSIMTFGKLRKNLGNKHIKGKYELLRFCNKLNTNVVGGASKLFKYFIKEYNPIEIISYADRRWSIGHIYETLKFDFDHSSKVNYFYVINNIRENRFNYRKDILISKYGCDRNDTEHNFCLSKKWYRIYDCGTKVYKWTKKEWY